MTWQTVFKIYQEPEKEKKVKQVTNPQQQVSQFPLFLASGENKNSNNSVKQTTEITEQLQLFLGEDWDDYKDNPEALALWADLIFKKQLIEQGKAPDNFTATTWCNLCGYVYVPSALTNGGTVLACPWCWNRVKGLPIPKPAST